MLTALCGGAIVILNKIKEVNEISVVVVIVFVVVFVVVVVAAAAALIHLPDA
jgi:hypothetical protein